MLSASSTDEPPFRPKISGVGVMTSDHLRRTRKSCFVYFRLEQIFRQAALRGVRIEYRKWSYWTRRILFSPTSGETR